MQVTLDINGRKALPLRAIPYVTSWKTSPDEIVGVLAAPKTTKTNHGTEILNRHKELFAYQMDAQGNVVQVPPSQWKQWIVTFDSLTKKLRANEREDAENENYSSWRIKAVMELPDNVFVWLDDFQPWYTLIQSQHGPIQESEHDDDDGSEQVDDILCMTPILSPEIENQLWRYPSFFIGALAQNAEIAEKKPHVSEQIDGPSSRPIGKIRSNKKIWDDAKLKVLWDESIQTGATNTSLAEKYGVSRQRIGLLITKAKKQFRTSSASTSTYSGLIHKIGD